MSFISYLINGISLGSVYAIIALGYTMDELRKKSESGLLSFEEFYAGFQSVAEAANGFGGAAVRQVNTINGAFSNLGDALDLLYDKLVTTSNINKLVIKSVQGLTSVINLFATRLTFDVKYIGFQFTYFYLVAKANVRITRTNNYAKKCKNM